MQVQFAGGHRIAVETEAVVKRESIWNTRRFADRRSCRCSSCVFRSLWLVTVGSLPSALSLALRARRARIHRRDALGSGHRRRRRCCSASASTASCCSTSRIAWRLRRAQTLTSPAALAGPSSEHAARHVDDGRDVLRTDVRRLSQPAAARPAPRPQHGGLRRPDAGHGAGAAAATAAAGGRCPRC